jgi:hypothetical protein
MVDETRAVSALTRLEMRVLVERRVGDRPAGPFAERLGLTYKQMLAIEARAT